jgi:uncharacterized protein YeaC (DUF1315 family)
MKQKIIIAFIFIFVLTGVILSQEKSMYESSDMSKMTTDEMVSKKLSMLKEELSLTESQTGPVQKILEDYFNKMQQVSEDGSASDDAVAKLKQKKEESLRTVLTDEQWTKYQAMKDKNKNKKESKY